jgi:hypothetical protein
MSNSGATLGSTTKWGYIQQATVDPHIPPTMYDNCKPAPKEKDDQEPTRIQFLIKQIATLRDYAQSVDALTYHRVTRLLGTTDLGTAVAASAANPAPDDDVSILFRLTEEIGKHLESIQYQIDRL